MTALAGEHRAGDKGVLMSLVFRPRFILTNGMWRRAGVPARYL
jgi:hypothetical protein